MPFTLGIGAPPPRPSRGDSGVRPEATPSRTGGPYDESMQSRRTRSAPPVPTAGAGRAPGTGRAGVVVEVLYALAVANGVLLLALIGATTGWTGPRDGAYVAVAGGFALAFGVLTLVRQRAPRTVLVVAMLVVCAYYWVGLPSIGMLLPLVVFLAAATLAGHRWFALAMAVVMTAVAVYFRLAGGESPRLVFGYELLSNLVLAVLAIVLAEVIRTHRQLQATQERAATLAAEAARAETESELLTERTRIARELHDDLGHALAVISLHANAAGERLDAGQPAGESLGHVREASRRAHGHLRQAVRALGRGVPVPAGDSADASTGEPHASSGAGSARPGLVGIEGIEPLVERLRAAGIEVHLERAGEVPAALGATVFRIVQEAATNAVSHAAPRHLWISLRAPGPAVLTVEVTNDGVTQPPRTGAGSAGGLAGVGLRVRERGGTSDWGFRRPDRFTVRAELPLAAGEPGRDAGPEAGSGGDGGDGGDGEYGPEEER